MRPHWHAGDCTNGKHVGWARFSPHDSWQEVCKAIDFWTCTTHLIRLALHAPELIVLPSGQLPQEWAVNGGADDTRRDTIHAGRQQDGPAYQ